MKLTDYIVEFLQRKGIHDFFGYQGTMIAHLVDSIEKNPHTKSHSSYRELHLRPAVMHRRESDVPVRMPQVVPGRRISYQELQMLILIPCR